MRKRTHMMSSNPGNWTPEEFKSFLLLYASHGDMDYSAAERAMILSIIDEKKLMEVENFFDQLGHYEQLEFIQRARPFFYPDIEKKEQLLALLARQFAADNRMSKIEISLLSFLERIL